MNAYMFFLVRSIQGIAINRLILVPFVWDLTDPIFTLQRGL